MGDKEYLSFYDPPEDEEYIHHSNTDIGGLVSAIIAFIVFFGIFFCAMSWIGGM